MNQFKSVYVNTNEQSPLFVDKFSRVSPYLSNNTNVYQPVLSQELYNRGFRPTYKDGKKYAVCFSHDIDFLYELKNRNSYIVSLLQSVKRLDLKGSYFNGLSIIKPQPKAEWA